jgi:hypothetical protein
MKIIIVISALVLYFSNCHLEAKTKKYERDYQKIFCKNLNGKIEYRLIDKTRIDCLTSEYAIEIDYGKKWAEAIGQSLYYSYMTNRKAGIGIIVDLKSKSDSRYLKRLYEVTKKLNIKVFIINK